MQQGFDGYLREVGTEKDRLPRELTVHLSRWSE